MEKAIKKYFPIFILPTVVTFFVIFVIPFFYALYLSFTKFTTVTDAKWVGVQNYREIFKNNDFLNALIFTVLFTIVAVITVNVFAFILATVLTRGLKGTNAFRTIFFVPNLIGGIVLGYIWQLIINGVLYQFGVDITFDEKYGFWGLVILTNWQLIGYMMVIYIAAIQNIPTELMEASKVDGANRYQVLAHITLPLVRPSITICLFLTLTNSFKMFDQNLALTAGAPAKKTSMLAYDIYSTFYDRVGYEGVGQAKAVIFFIIVAVVAFVQLSLSRERGD